MLHLKSLRPSRGFTLVEILIVMAILAALALVAIPWFVKISQRSALKSAAREVQTTLLAARMKAVKRNQPIRVVIVSTTPPLRFDTIEPNPPAPTPTHVPGRLVLPAKAASLYATPNTAGGTLIFGGDGRVSNAPVPVATPAEMILQGPVGAGNMNQIKIRAHANGRIEVITPTNWQ
jgi:prepilin-type N-terminal cleavage/methylation domain-containing protein